MRKTNGKNFPVPPAEKKAINFLIEKMGISRKEVQEISNLYGVNAAQLIELMQLSKYQFVHDGKMPGQCQPCTTIPVRLRALAG